MFTVKKTVRNRAVTSSVTLWAIVALCAWGVKSFAQPAPPNDNLANAQGIIGASGSLTSTNLFATAQAGEPAPFPGNPAESTIWFAWTAPINATIDFNTRGSTDPFGNEMQTVLAVYKFKTGTNLAFNNLTLVAQNEYDPSGYTASRVDFAATLDTEYLIQVDGANIAGTNTQGYPVLNWGSSLVAGGFGFSSSTFAPGSLDDYIPFNDGPIGIGFDKNVGPSLHANAGDANVRITVTRSAPAVGRCEVQFTLGSALYTNLYYTNYVYTNIFLTNYSSNLVEISYTNTFTTNTESVNLFQNDEAGFFVYLPLEAFGINAITNADGVLFPYATNVPVGGFVLTNLYIGTDNPDFPLVPVFFTNFPSELFDTCPVINPVSGLTTNQDGSITFALTNVGCSFFGTNVDVPAGVAGIDYTPLSTNLTFDDFQMSQDVYVQINPEVFLDLPGPEDDGLYAYPGLNSLITVSLTNAVLDPLEDPDILAPTISQANAALNVLNMTSDPNPVFTNNAEFLVVNLERATFRVDKGGGVYAQFSVERFPIGAAQSTLVRYTFDSDDPGNTVYNYNKFLTVADSDYAIPFDDQALFDFNSPTNAAGNWNGLYGTLNWNTGDPFPKEIEIPIGTNTAVEFDSDIYVQLFYLPTDNPGETSPLPTSLGNISTANLTINFDYPPGGAVDTTYNVDNAPTSFPPENQVPGADQQVNAIAIQPNGMAVIGGDFTSYNTTPIDYVARLQTNGFLDPVFLAGAGSGANDQVNAVAIDSSGRIIIGGNFTSFNGTNAFHIARLNFNGSLDMTFTNGVGFNGDVWALAIDANGNIVVGGDFTSYDTTNCDNVARLLPTGGLDTTFLPSSGAPGFGTDQEVLALAFDSFGDIILGGEFTHVNGTNWNYLARLLPSGALDTNFNPGTGPNNTVYAVAAQPNNEILLGGAFQSYYGQSSPSMARLNYNGSLDTSFPVGSGANDLIYSIVVQPDGNILVGGQFTTFNTSRRIGVVRLLSDGWVDTSFMDTAYNQFAGLINNYFNTNAYNPNDFPNPYNFRNAVYAMGLQGDGNVVIGGAFQRVGGGSTRAEIHTHLNVARLVGPATPGPENGGIGNNPGNITLTQDPYTVDDTANKLYVTLDRVNGSLGPATVTLGTNTLAPGPGSATAADFGLSKATATYGDIWNMWEVTDNTYGWRESDGFYGFNNVVAPLGDNNASELQLSIQNDKSALDNLFASLSLLNLNSVNLLTLGGVTIPSSPALGTPAAPLEIVDANTTPGTFGFSATNYTVVNTAGTVTLTMLRTNGSSGKVEVFYETRNGATNSPGTNTAIGVSSPTDANGDYVTVTSGSVTFQGGQTSAQLTPISIIDHSTMQPTKVFTVYITSVTGGGSIDTNVPPLVPSDTDVEIIDGNFQPGHLEFSSPGYSVLKGGLATVTVNRVGGALGQLTVECGTSDGTGTNGINYIGTTNTLVWTNQDITPQSMTIQTLQDNVVEGAKTVNLTLFNANVVGSQGGLTNSEVLAYPSNSVLTINDTDSYGTIGFAVPNFNVLQNSGQALITVVRTNGAIGTVSVNYATANGTNAPAPYQTALAGTNYGATNGVLTFGPGVTSQSFVVPIYYTPDETNAANRIVNLILFADSSNIASQFPETATLTILDNQLVLNPAGGVDTTTLNGVGFNNFVNSLTLQPDGSVLAGGDFTLFDEFLFDYVARLLPDGAYDATFLQNQAGANNSVLQVMSQSPTSGETNGPIMVVGNFSQFDQVNRGGIARLNLDGSLDETFNPGSGADSSVFSIAQMFLPSSQTNQLPVLYYVIGGNFANYNGVSSSGVARVTEAGTLDPNFKIDLGVTGSNGTVHVVAIEPNNQILLGGDFTSFNNEPHHYLVRLNIDGSVDTNFAAFDGIHSDINGSVRAIQVQPNSQIIIGGLFTLVDGSSYNYIARLNSDGTLDTNFNVGAGCNAAVLTLALDSQTRILVGGQFSQASGVTRNGITRLNPDGTVDPTINFGPGANGFIDTIIIQTNDEIDVGGGFTTFNNVAENNFARLYGGANVGEGSLQFNQQVYGVMENGSNALITIQRLGGEGTTAEPVVSAVFSTADGTAVSGKNYIGVTNTVTFPLGETFETVEVPILPGSTLGSNLTVNLNLTDPVYASLGPQASATLIITNINTGLSFSATGYRESANVPSGEAVIPVIRVGDPNDTVAVTVYTGTNGTATPGTNYIPATNVLVFTPGVLTNDFLVQILNSPTTFGDVTVDLEMSGASNAILTSPDSALLTIGSVFAGPGFLAFSQTNYTVSEGATNALITLVRTNGSAGQVSVTFNTTNGTAVAGINYSNVSTLVSWADDDSSSKTVSIPIIQQAAAGPDLTVLLNLTNATGGATIAGLTQETLTIENDIPNFSFASPSYFVSEGAGSINVFIVRSGPTNFSAKVNYTTYSPPGANETNGFAVPNVDYIPTSGTLTFGPGQTLQSIPIGIKQGIVVNGLLTFQVVLSTNASSDVQIGVPGVTTVGIISDVSGFDFSTNNYEVGENGSNVVITVDRVNPNTGLLQVQFATSDGTAVNTVDYVATNGTLVFQDGQSTATITVAILNPGIVESNKTFGIALFNPSPNSYLVSPSNAVVTITNVYSGVSFGSPSFSVSECAGEATIPVILTGLTNNLVQVNFATQNGSAQEPGNYTTTNGTLIFLPGQTTQTFNVQVINNQVIGPNHTVILELTNAVGAQLLNPSTAILTIDECNGTDIVPSGTAWVNGTPDNGIIYSNDQVTILFGLRDIAGGNTTNLVATLLPTNGVTNVTSGSADYGVLVQGGPTVSRAFTFTAVGSNGQNIIATFALKDGSTTLSNVVFGLTLGGTTFSFTNSEPITMYGGPVIPTRATNGFPPYYGYPSAIDVAGLVGTGSQPANVTGVTVTLTNFGHSFPADVEVLLEAPSTQDTILMSHCGGASNVQHITLTFSQLAGAYLPLSNTLVSGTFLPTTNTTEMFQLPTVEYPTNGVPTVPTWPYPANLNDVTGGTPNGNWLLWVVDDDTLDSGYISNGWILNISIGSPVESDADLELAVSPSPSNPTLSNTLTYSVTLTNYGPAGATNVVITDVLPAGVSFVGSSCSCVTEADGVATATISSLAVGNGTAFTIQVLPTALGYITNVVTATADEADPNSNNVVTDVSLVSAPSADVGVSLSPTAPVLLGGDVTYNIVVTNGGPSTALGVVAVDVLPAGFEVISITPSTGTATNSSGTITWNVGSVSPGSSPSLSIVTEALAAGILTDSVSVSSSVYDPYKLNNFASVKTEVGQTALTLNNVNHAYTLTWEVSASNYVLEGATNLPPLGTWIPITNPAPPVVNGQYDFALPGTNGYHFFRLKAEVP